LLNLQDKLLHKLDEQSVSTHVKLSGISQSQTEMSRSQTELGLVRVQTELAKTQSDLVKAQMEIKARLDRVEGSLPSPLNVNKSNPSDNSSLLCCITM